MNFLSLEFVGDERNMNRLFAVLFVSLALLGHSFSQYDGSGTGDDEAEIDEDIEDGSGGDALTKCQERRRDHAWTKCQNNGQFAPRQCSQSQTSCWCVDQHGKEIPGTRGILDCDGYGSADITFEEPREVKPMENNNPMLNHPGLLAGVIGGVVVCLLCAVLIVMFIVYRMKKKDEGSYILGRAERKNSRSVIYTKAVPRDQEFYA